ncbi:Dipeptidyl aminopeptidase/acylaminoacyl peptidase [Mucilaginibacter pineti]|uniref:Dipeptidyl aminopeptidase/acylaminoacyl peptidase n=1 Tax=Mucilaginibacter pineti TaxID=1391627 RepID=A0A1G7IJA8_9SPHI|nr:prolyl oligopeptidase family serine peptidase [Mucilaginibacter pineti]SDF12840.1 Dipeptidyl aminopeptidase/acylaminoacyl peptidase [Mucilaginibacter pineti]
MGSVGRYILNSKPNAATLIWTAFIWLCPLLLCAQKKPLENRHYPEWSTDYKPRMSRNGEYAVYQLQHKWLLYNLGSSARFIKELPAGEPEFMPDSKNLLLKDAQDTLHIYALNKTLTEKKICGVGDWAFSPDKLIYIKSADKSLHVSELSSSSETVIGNVASFKMSSDRSRLAYLSASDGKSIGTLNIKNPAVSKETVFRDPVTEYLLSANGRHIAASTEGSSGQIEISLLDTYKETQIKTTPLLRKLGAYGLSENSFWFSPAGDQLFFMGDSLAGPEKDTLNKPNSPVEVWHYKDRELQSMQVNETGQAEKMTAVYDLGKEKLQIINHSGEDAISVREINNNGYHLVFSRTTVFESGWDERNKVSCWLLCSSSGKRTAVFQKVGIPFHTQISPDGRFVIWYDNEKHAYFSFSISSHITRKLDLAAGNIPDFTGEDPSLSSSPPYGLCGWSKDGKTFFIYDRFDIWQLDPSGAAKPVCLTARWGAEHRIRLRLPSAEGSSAAKTIDPADGLILKAFDVNTKESGFVKADFSSGTALTTLYMGPYVFSDLTYSPGTGSYILCRSSENEAPNIFWSGDLRNFKQLSGFAPQKQVNWMTSELIRLKRHDGSWGKAILYKPENFDAAKKYPAIVHFYEKRSDQLHSFLLPALSRAEINIPFYVSNGYLVLVPDIDYAGDSLGRAAVKCVQPGIDYLKNLDFVDEKAIGLQGHSFGAYEANFILTQTSDIAAACSAAGLCDLISASTTLSLDGKPHYTLYDLGQMRKNRPVWQNPESYIRDSPLFYANRISSPLLLMHNRNDPNVNFDQDVQLFLTLRRLQKPVWLLQYPNSGHFAYAPDEKDFSIRMLQFFDHFLKHKPAPVWLSKGIPASRSKIDSGLEYEVTPD